MEKYKIEKNGYVFEEEVKEGESVSDILPALKEKYPNHDIFKDCEDGVFRGFAISVN